MEGGRKGQGDTESCSMLLKQCGGHRRSTTHLDLLGERGREHHGLTLTHRRHPILLHNAADLRLKPHVQHTVSLVQHQISCEGGREEREGKGREKGRGRGRGERKGERGEEGKGIKRRIRRAQVDSKLAKHILLCYWVIGSLAHFKSNPAPLHHVHQPSWSRHQQQTATLQVSNLCSNVCTSVHHTGTHTGPVGKLASLVVDLGGKLSGGSEDEAQGVLLAATTSVPWLEKDSKRYGASQFMHNT